MKEPSLSLSRFRKKSASKVKLICSFNGAFHVRPSSNKLRYIGGETRIISVDRTISFSKLRLKISDICSNIHSFTLKYRLPLDPDPKPDDDTPLVLIASDDDVRCMVEEYDKLESFGKHARLWVFVCTDLCDDDKSSCYNNGVVKGNGVADDSLRKKVMKQQLLAKQSCDSPLIDLDFGLQEPNDSVVRNDPFRVNVANGLGNRRLRPLNPRDGNVRNIAVRANATVECLMGRSFQGFSYGGGYTTLMGNSVDGKRDFGNTGQMPFSNFNRENIMPLGTTCGSVNNFLGVRSCSNLRVGSGCPVKSSCVGGRVCGACQSGPRGNRFAVNDARYQRIYPYYAINHKSNLVELGNHRGVRLDGKIAVGKCYLEIRPNSNISKQGTSMGSYNANLLSPWAGFTELASEGVVSVMGSCFNKGISTFDVQYGEKFREHGGPAISQYGNSNLMESHLACHGTYNVLGDQFFMSHNAINNPSTFVRVMNTKDDMLTGSNFEQCEVQCQAQCENFRGMPINCKPIHPELENEKLLIDSEESANISGLSNNMTYRNGTALGCNMKNGTKNLLGGVASSMDLLYNLSFSSSKEIEPPQISSLQNAATGKIDKHKEEIQRDPLEEKTCECPNVIGEISSRSAAYFTITATAELQTIKTSDLEYIKELGSGTFGTVFYGKWKGSDVAIKRIKPSCFTEGLSEEDRLVADFWREAHMLGQLHHPNVVAFYGVVTDGPVTNLATVTEYMVNGSLKQVLRRKDRTIDRRKRIIIAMDAAFGIEYLHEKNIVHFDLKSHNFLVNMRDPQRPVCKIGDLGLSKIKQKTLISGGVRGTIPWMAPELFNSKDNLVTEKIDVYSFGIVMWELLTGEEPYADLHSEEIIAGIIKGSLRPEIPSWCEPTWRSLMERCWSSDPYSRPAFSEIAKELRAMAAAMNIK